ncbi:MAG: hypothetical protein HYZ53_28070 [Planctomycetes bacterium]|nr:hypothetical protein [Planctomycetota bacterium]
MASVEHYRRWIAAYVNQREIEGLIYRGVLRSADEAWPPGKAFEYGILRVFELFGGEIVQWPFEVTVGPGVVEQIDGVVFDPDLRTYFLVESKQQAEPLNFEPIAKLRAQLERRPVSTMGLVFSPSGFTRPALVLAQAPAQK